MLEVNDFDAIRISLASPEQIRSWSYGEVTKPETINYRTLKPERDGLFCEKIFGPTKDYECFCGKYKKIRYKGIICDKCGVEVARSKVRRERMGHIQLASPVSHIWFAKGIPSRLGLLLDLSPRNLERVLYFSHYIVTDVDETAREAAIEELKQRISEEAAERRAALEEKIASEMPEATVEEINQLRREQDAAETPLRQQLLADLEQLKELAPKKLLNETEYREYRQKWGTMFEAGMGAEAILKIIRKCDLNELRNQLIEETRSSSGQRRKKASKRLQVVEAFRRSGNRPEWMILTVLPVLPPDLRPTVQLDGGRFAISDINDLYRRVINRNNRLKHLIDIGAPEIIIRNEKRMLQEAVDSLIDNGKRGQPVSISGNHKLKSLSDMLRGKQGRFRQNLLGKRVDYSGRSVIVIGPELKLHQCGLPRRMALELFKPFVMRDLIAKGLAQNIKSARRLVEKAKPEVYDILEEVVKERPVLLNRAPTLHRLSIQAFEPVLIDGSAIQIHPLVCSAFNADFDGDQMAVHIPLSRLAVKGARETMLSIHNMLLPSSGEPVVTPTLDMVLGCYYLTTLRQGAKGEGRIFSSFEEARLAYELGAVDLRAEIEVRTDASGERIRTSVGRIIFNEALPDIIPFYNDDVDKSVLKRLVTQCSKRLPDEEMAAVMDNLKSLGFRYATKSGTTIAMSDIEVPATKAELLREAEEKTAAIEDQYNRGLITYDERYNALVSVWMETTDRVGEATSASLDPQSGIYMMATSGAKGNITQIRQMAGMRGLMTNPSGRIIDFPIKASFSEGLSVLEYFISTHGARKGLADTALRTSESGYLTRRLVDVAHDVIVKEEDCGTTDGVWIRETAPDEMLPPLAERIIGRMAAAPITHPETGNLIVDRNDEITEEVAEELAAAGLREIYVRSPLTCQARQGVCQRCYGRDLGRGRLVDLHTAVGIIAAQSIGEPGTQLTLRTFHTGGVVGLDITTGLPRVEELFESRTPKNQAVISEINGTATVTRSDEGQTIKVTSSEPFQIDQPVPEGWEVLVTEGAYVEAGTVLARPPATEEAKPEEGAESTELAPEPLLARVSGTVSLGKGTISISYEETEEREYHVPAAVRLRVQDGDVVAAGQQLTEGSINPQDILHVLGREAVQRYLVDEVQKVYRSQGVNINDKHIEIIVRQMLSKVRTESSGDTELVPGELVNRFEYEDINAKVLAEGGEPATARPLLLGITRAALSTNSWLAAASFQETTKVLTEAAVRRATDHLIGLKENVIIGRLIPARYQSRIPDEPEEAPALETPARLPFLEGTPEERRRDDDAAGLLSRLMEQPAAEFHPEAGPDESPGPPASPPEGEPPGDDEDTPGPDSPDA